MAWKHYHGTIWFFCPCFACILWTNDVAFTNLTEALVFLSLKLYFSHKLKNLTYKFKSLLKKKLFKTFKCHRLLNKYPMGMFQPTPFTWWKCLILLAVGMKSRPTLTVGRYICVFQYQFHVTLTEIENVTYTKTFCSRNLNAPADKSSAYQWRASGRRLISNYSFHSQFASQFHISCHLKILW